MEPYTMLLWKVLAGIKKLAIVCPAFVSDCLETLEEISEEGKEIFLHGGGERFDYILV
jgi:ferrochelatase